jgi:hypothetical protein
MDKKIWCFLILLLIHIPMGLGSTCDGLVTYCFHEKNLSDIPNVNINQSDKNLTGEIDWSSLNITQVYNYTNYPDDIWNWIDNHTEYGGATVECHYCMQSPNYSHTTGKLDSGDQILASISMLNNTGYSQCVLYFCGHDRDLDHATLIYKENNKIGVFSNDQWVGYNNYSDMEFHDDVFDTIDPILINFQRARMFRYSSWEIFCADEHPEFINELMNSTSINVYEGYEEGEHISFDWSTGDGCENPIQYQKDNILNIIESNYLLYRFHQPDLAPMFLILKTIVILIVLTLFIPLPLLLIYKAIQTENIGILIVGLTIGLLSIIFIVSFLF